MRLINVNALLDVEKSISKQKEPDPRMAVLVELHGTALAETKYATLSHCWGPPEQELQFKEMKKFIIMDERRRNEVRKRSGYKKILDACKQARQDQFDWVWVDTCCINKDSSSELSEAINSMFRWYEKSERCYAYLHDIDESVFPSEPDKERFYEFNGWPKWFSRGWTLQELVAPKDVYFFNQQWTFIGDKKCLANTLESITQIVGRILEDGLSSKRPCVAQIMSWAADRKTTREEDGAYSLLGLLGVHMPMMYGEGKNAFRRLQLEVIRMTNDQSIFAWGHSRETGWSSSFLAPDPSFFRDCSYVEKMDLDEFILHHKNEIPEDELRKVMDPEERLRTFTVTNDGIQIWLLLRHWRGSTSLFQTELACRSLSSVPRSITINVAQFKSKYFRYFGYCDAPLYEKMQFQQVFFPYQDDIHPSDFTFNLDLRTVFHDGFIQHDVFPEVKLTDGTLTLTDVNDCAIIFYAHPKRNIRFAVAFHYCFGQPLIHVICCEPPGDPERCVPEVYRDARRGGPDKANRMVKRWSNSRTDCLAKHVHIPRSIQGVKVAYGWPSQLRNSCAVMIDVAQCTGCCDSTWHGWNGFDIGPTVSGLLKAPMPRGATYPVYGLFVDSSYMRFVLAEPGIELRLGDYGRQLRNGSLAREGNIFDLATEYGIALDPDKHNMIFDRDTVSMERDVVKIVYDGQDNFCTVLLRNATGWSLPNDQIIVFLLKFLASRLPTRLAGRHLVSTVIHCSECCYTEDVQGALATTWPKCTGDSPHSRWRKIGTASPLYSLRMPLVWWRQEVAEWETRSQFNAIRHNIYILLSLADSKSKAAAIEFLTNIFGEGYFRDFIGEIGFFKDLAVVAASIGKDGIPYGQMVKGDECDSVFGLPTSSRGNSSSVQTEDATLATVPCIEVLAEKIMKEMLCDEDGLQARKLRHKAEEFKSKSFGRELLCVISEVYRGSPASFVPGSWPPRSKMNGIMQGDIDEKKRRIQSFAQEVEAFQNMLDGMSDASRRRALEEDITGKILLSCWNEIRSEVWQTLSKVVDHVVRDTVVYQQAPYTPAWYRHHRLKKIGQIFADVTSGALDEGPNALQRIIADAEAGISKHQLLLQAQADGTANQNDYRGPCSTTNHDQRSAAATRSMTTMEYKPGLPPRRGWTA